MLKDRARVEGKSKSHQLCGQQRNKKRLARQLCQARVAERYGSAGKRYQETEHWQQRPRDRLSPPDRGSGLSASETAPLEQQQTPPASSAKPLVAVVGSISGTPTVAEAVPANPSTIIAAPLLSRAQDGELMAKRAMTSSSNSTRPRNRQLSHEKGSDKSECMPATLRPTEISVVSRPTLRSDAQGQQFAQRCLAER